VDILIVGAGMAGLSAACELTVEGLRVCVVDKGRGVGGRLATRRIVDARLDHGAQFMTTRDPRFSATVQCWHAEGVVTEWFRSQENEGAGHARWRGMSGMTDIAKHMAEGLDVRLSCAVTRVGFADGCWAVDFKHGARLTASAVILTPPVPQSLALLEAGGVELASDHRATLDGMTYDRCLAVMAILDGSSGIDFPGWFRPDCGLVDWVADNQVKGISTVPALTIHASADYSLENWDRDRHACAEQLLAAVRPRVCVPVNQFQVHGWRYSKPRRIVPRQCLVLRESPPLVLAGDAFGGARVEGAALSGWAAASALRSRM
jgi:predicted NAD/FAD-dependent oxidoreductase